MNFETAQYNYDTMEEPGTWCSCESEINQDTGKCENELCMFYQEDE